MLWLSSILRIADLLRIHGKSAKYRYVDESPKI
jgi:hypothetical protein